MRVLEPRHHFKAKTVKKTLKQRLPLLALSFAGVLILLYLLLGQNLDLRKQPGMNKTAETEQASAEKTKKLKTFTGEEFKALYSSFAYPNTQPLSEPPTITGNDKADARIQRIAEDRGYQLSAVPVSNIVKINEPGLSDDDLIQPLAQIGWQAMKQAAAKDDIKLQITSAYRSIDFQRALFMRRLADAGATVFGIADGYSDLAVEQVLSRAAAPGYSRHHTGFTIDFACDGIGLEGFKKTTCYEWLSRNNFENAKKYGFVPSYPEEAEDQGPEPEAWEYIWVGTSSLYE